VIKLGCLCTFHIDRDICSLYLTVVASQMCSKLVLAMRVSFCVSPIILILPTPAFAKAVLCKNGDTSQDCMMG
jgi:hypothetical protein